MNSEQNTHRRPRSLAACALLALAALQGALNYAAASDRDNEIIDCAKALDRAPEIRKLVKAVQKYTAEYIDASKAEKPGVVARMVEAFKEVDVFLEPFERIHEDKKKPSFKILTTSKGAVGRLAKYLKQSDDTDLVWDLELKAEDRTTDAYVVERPGTTDFFLPTKGSSYVVVSSEILVQSITSPLKTIPVIRHELIHAKINRLAKAGLPSLFYGVVSKWPSSDDAYSSFWIDEVAAYIESFRAALQEIRVYDRAARLEELSTRRENGASPTIELLRSSHYLFVMAMHLNNSFKDLVKIAEERRIDSFAVTTQRPFAAVSDIKLSDKSILSLFIKTTKPGSLTKTEFIAYLKTQAEFYEKLVQFLDQNDSEDWKTLRKWYASPQEDEMPKAQRAKAVAVALALIEHLSEFEDLIRPYFNL